MNHSPLTKHRVLFTMGLLLLTVGSIYADGTHLFVLSGQSNMQGLKPEESFTPMVEEWFGIENVIVVKDALGGQPIRRWHKAWQLGEGDNPKQIGDLYDQLMAKVNEAIKDEEIASVTFLWMQGEKDAREQHGDVYAASFNGLLDQLRADLGRNEINFVIGRLSDFGLENEDYPDWRKMRTVLVDLANSSRRGAWVDTDDLNDGRNRRGKEIKDDLHYSAEGYVTFGKRLADAAIQLIEKNDVLPKIEPPYYSVRYQGSREPGRLLFPVRYTVWVPPHVETLRGVVVHQHGCGVGSCKSGLTGAFDLHWQALAKKHDCALLAASYEQPEEADCQLWCDPRNGSDAAFQKSLSDLGEASGHPELAEVPWALWGHSGGGVWAGTMTLLYPDRVAAAWLRSGVPLLEPRGEHPSANTVEVPDERLEVPMMLNPGTKEGVTVKEGRFAGVWPRMETLFVALRGQDAPIGIAVDPLTSHECGNQRYLAIPWFDTCLAARLSGSNTQTLRVMPADNVWLAPLLGTVASPETDYTGNKSQAVWLPNESFAKAWMQYTKDTAVTDTSPPPAPKNVRATDGEITWVAEADLESGIAHFIILRDGKELTTVPSQSKNPFGRPLFQGLQYSDTPLQPLVPMRFTDTTWVAGQNHVYKVIAVNTVGLKSQLP
ncbi:sialate O-acetylesterase [Novipirellula artificiosorum]|uniref:Sialate O-acetylesterase domain-containing protein n=1 Tax=Novipirellula artificiosorum TaxID=2528016 RepID=A0A5C6DXX0_9BACT|nr:sialate O-acetylesterase [Novipirellula artificiosorum]TWU39679.1 hypothetical protein Poly41_25350 [Novipirellula artificiosorum]